jgi:hypothetical protein
MTSKAWKTIHEENGAVAAEGSNCHTSMLCVPSPAAPAGRDAAGTLAFPDHFPKMFPFRQNTVSLVYHLTRHSPRSAQRWKQVRHVLQKEAMRAKERKEELWKFLRLDKIYKEVVIQPKVQRLRENLAEKEKKRRKFTEKPPPGLNCVAWLLGVVPALRRAPNGAARLAWRVAG